MNDTDKLRVLIPHWIEHNQEHAQEFLDWVNKIDQTVEIENAIADVRVAAEAMIAVNAPLRTALEKLGGSLEYDYDHLHFHEHEHSHTHQPHE